MNTNNEKVKLTFNKKSIANLSNNNSQNIKEGYLPEAITSLFLCINTRRNCIETLDNCTLICTMPTF